MQAVILAGGKGTRLAERLNGRPKPLIDVGGVPLLERQVLSLAQHGVDDVVVLVNHAADQIEKFFVDRNFPSRIRLIDDGAPRGTAGALLACLDELQDRFLVVYGDTLFDIDIAHMVAAHEAAHAEITLLLHPNDHPADSDLVELDEAGRVLAFHGYPHPEGAQLRNLVNAAFYVIDKKALTSWRDYPVPSDLAKDLFPAMVTQGARLNGYISYEYIKDLGTPKRLDKVERHLANGVVDRASRRHPQRAVFLDRDGTLNSLRSYIRKPEELELLPGAARSVHRLNDAEYRVVLITNQPVVARGECTLEGLRLIHNRLESELGKEGGYLDGIYYCPHHPDAGFPGEVRALKMDCECRKPKAGMLKAAMRAMNIHAAESWMVGDSSADMLASQSAGLRSVLVATGEGGRDHKYFAIPDFRVADIAEATHLIVDAYPLIARQIADILEQVRGGDLVLIGGLARCGKSTVSGAIRCELAARGLGAKVLPLDGWVLPPGERGPGLRGRFELDAAAQALAPWLQGGASRIDVPTYERESRQRHLGGVVAANSDDVLIVEGVPAPLLAMTTRRRIWRVHLEGDEGQRRARVIADLMARGAATKEEAADIYEERQVDEAVEVVSARAQADAILNLDSVYSAIAHHDY